VATPVSAATVAVVREIDQAVRKQAPENIREVLARAGV